MAQTQSLCVMGLKKKLESPNMKLLKYMSLENRMFIEVPWVSIVPLQSNTSFWIATMLSCRNVVLPNLYTMWSPFSWQWIIAFMCEKTSFSITVILQLTVYILT